MLAKLQRATMTFYEDFGPIVFLYFEGQRPYAYRPPTPDSPAPEGWTSLTQLVARPTASEIAAGWRDDEQRVNPILSEMLRNLEVAHRGQSFVLSEVALQGMRSASFVPLVQVEAPKPTARAATRTADTAAASTAAATTHSEAPAFKYGTAYQLEKIHVGAQVALEVKVRGADEAHYPRFYAPDANDHTPANWWFLETFTGISKERVVDGWSQNRNPVLDDVILRITDVLNRDSRVPLRRDGSVDLAYWRRQLVRSHLASGQKPFVFLGRPDHDVEHTRELLYAAAGDRVFRSSVDPGVALGKPIMITDIAGVVGMQPLENLDVMRGVLNSYIRFARTGRPPRAQNPPKELMGHLVELPDTRWPQLDGVVRIPVMREDGTILTRPGYDALSQLWYAPSFELEPIPDTPSAAEVAEAKQLIMTPLAQFPFVDDGALAGALASLFEQVVRPMIKGPRPLYIFDAPKTGQGSGKTLLAKTFQTVITGGPTMTALGRKEEEIEKRITVQLRQQAVFVICDNLTTEIKSEALQQLATSERWQARLLNTNEAPIFCQNATWVLTLNNAKVNRDIARRTVLVALDTKLENPHMRTGFAIENLVEWARERRAAIIRAILILARSWVAAGKPSDPRVVLGSFESWAHVVGGVLHHSGWTDLPKALKAAFNRMVDQEELDSLVRVWATELGQQNVAASVIGDLAIRHGLYPDKLPAKGNAGAVGRAMKDILDTILTSTAHGLRIVRLPKLTNGYTTYVLEEVATSGVA